MRLVEEFSRFVVAYESEREYALNRLSFTLDGYAVVNIERKSENEIVVTYERHEIHTTKGDNQCQYTN